MLEIRTILITTIDSIINPTEFIPLLLVLISSDLFGNSNVIAFEMIGNTRKDKIAKINVDKIQYLVEKKILNENEKISLENLKNKKILNKSYKKIKVLGSGNINLIKPIHIKFKGALSVIIICSIS